MHIDIQDSDKMTIEAIAVDIDGTITDEKRQICISAIEALRKAESNGIPTIIVTGNVVNYAYAAEVLIGCSGGLVAENGGVVFKEKSCNVTGNGYSGKNSKYHNCFAGSRCTDD